MVPPALRPLRLNTVELLRQPGSSRSISVVLDADALGVQDPRVVAPIRVELEATSTLDGITVTGSVEVPLVDECRRCLAELHLDGRVDVDETYADADAAAPDADVFELGPDALDLSEAVGDAVRLRLADPPPLCRPDCAGLCPICGADRNVDPCSCDTSVRDERWAALDGLELPDPGHDSADRPGATADDDTSTDPSH